MADKAQDDRIDARDQGRDAVVCPEDRDRVALYGLLASGLQGPVGQDWLDVVSGLSGGGDDLADAIAGLASAAAQADPESLGRNYHDLFIGVGRGELVPYGSYYLTGFLNEKPLALLRQDMRRLGIERDPDVKEPEDHIAALCQMMAGLIEGDFGDGVPATSSRFFRAHLASWAPYFFKDLAATGAGAVYPALGRLGQVFIDLEEHADALFEQRRGAV
ncbi:TorD/DmsD family molecular chaperone [Stappia stellulata]|uniref:TorD/DmsD family molecular chaperone n=1 Tax=Stappia stellulata TaxID=71235 RepID=UPI000A0673EE|nr:molecular chaperone TorD family protein [Stappia stellulata]